MFKKEEETPFETAVNEINERLQSLSYSHKRMSERLSVLEEIVPKCETFLSSQSTFVEKQEAIEHMGQILKRLT